MSSNGFDAYESTRLIAAAWERHIHNLIHDERSNLAEADRKKMLKKSIRR